MNVKFNDVEIGIIWEALTECISIYSKEKAKKFLKLREKIERAHGDNT